MQKFWMNWKIGMTQIRKERSLSERMTCWRKSCDFCGAVPVTDANRHGQFAFHHTATCKHWWMNITGRSHLGDEKNPAAARADRPEVENDYRACVCCGVDTGIPALGCRCFGHLQEPGYLNPSEAPPKMKSVAFQTTSPTMIHHHAMMGRSSSAPHLKRTPRHSARLTLSAGQNL